MEKKQHSSKKQTNNNNKKKKNKHGPKADKKKNLRENVKYFELNKTGDKIYQKFLVGVNTGLRRKCVALSMYIRKEKGVKSTV